MATYEYRCQQDGSFDTTLPIGAAGPAARCPRCGGRAARVFSAPRLSRTPAPLRQAIDRAERSAEAPDVVTRVPGRPPIRRSPNPAHARLPRW
ncbi:Zinc ribbon domain protein [Micromonospora sp. MW-13]|uniref:FmdB family zinc ribbon protein n=1 Tax=unclassified Micromonospora TaxID=2617518 RepID=UPI000E442E6E|nr:MULTISPECIES: zinc ribbon domain-containing protein [unclassified Micromonospora]MCX4472570.1 zinc ribbon domain-containing protein [Micromonospora sp. NBC_01655]RGC69259.1 Zinc ribbon domain protein [Micromonospora sp. MW-13]